MAIYSSDYKSNCERCGRENHCHHRGGKKANPQTTTVYCLGCGRKSTVRWHAGCRAVPRGQTYMAPYWRPSDYHGLVDYPPVFATWEELQADPGRAMPTVVPDVKD